MSRNARRIALSLGTAAGAALIAASFSLGTAPVAGADPVSDLVGAIDPAAAVSAAGVPETMAFSYLIEALDPYAFNSAGAPIGALGLLGYYTDTYLLGPAGLDAELAPLVQSLVGTVSSGTPGTYTPEISDLIAAFDPNAFTGGTPGVAPTDALGELGYFTDTYLFGPTGIDNLIAPYVTEIIDSLHSSAESVDVSPVSDLIAALDPSAFAAGVADVTAPTAAGLVDPVVDGLLNSGLSLF
ncbi:hypothetical protein [Mycobacterium sp.]|uniref:hypothetical protein n=1 Tax=Mycobacterium sp. TaxID=1785 RepID=UPI003BAE3731